MSEAIKAAIAAGKTVLGVEFGSTRIKAVLIDETHQPVAMGTHDWENRLENGIWTYSLEDIWNGFQSCYRSLCADVQEKYHMPLTRIGAIGISGMMHGYMPFDKEGKLLVPFRTWRNTITEEACKKLIPVFNFNIPQRWSIAHLYQAILNDEPHVKDIDFFTTLAGYIHWKLTGRKVLGVENTSPKGLNFILYGNPGTGKTSVARIIGELLYQMGLVQENQMIETDRSGLVDSVIGGTEKKTMQVLESARGKTLFIDEAYTLYKEKSETDFGRVAIDLLLKDIEDHRGEYCVILAGYKLQMENMIKKANRGFASRFDYKIEIPDYSYEELVNIIVKMAEARHYKISVDARSAIISRIDREKIDETFDNARFMRRLLDSAIEKQSLRLVAAGNTPDRDDLCYLLKEDFQAEGENSQAAQASGTDYLAELDNLIGLEGVKKEVHTLEQTARITAEQKRRGMQTFGTGTLHLAFTGNPGTGKTTVARLLAKIYNQLGLLKRGDVFVECGRAQLVGNHVGETAMKVTDTVNSALGGVLFIDEVYNLVNGENDSFGMEALNTLIAEMENHADRLMVIIAGYTDEVKDFMRKNPGMESRISNVIEFSDYTVDEMVQIFRLNMKKRGLDTAALRDEAIHQLIDSRCHVPNFGNGRGVRNLCDSVVRKHNSRLTSLTDISVIPDRYLVTLEEEDLTI